MRTRFVLLVLLGLLLIAACVNQGTNQPAPGKRLGFEFTIDPQHEVVTLVERHAPDASGPTLNGDSVPLGQGQLALERYAYRFLPDQELEIFVSFRNITPDRDFRQAFYFTASGSNYLDSVEPEVTDEHLGGDGNLGFEETTSVFRFVVHRRSPTS